MKLSGRVQQSLYKILSLLFLVPISFVSKAQQTGVWERAEVKEKMTDVAAQKKKKLNLFIFRKGG